jgi:hypothetical protein
MADEDAVADTDALMVVDGEAVGDTEDESDTEDVAHIEDEDDTEDEDEAAGLDAVDAEDVGESEEIDPEDDAEAGTVADREDNGSWRIQPHPQDCRSRWSQQCHCSCWRSTCRCGCSACQPQARGSLGRAKGVLAQSECSPKESSHSTAMRACACAENMVWGGVSKQSD